MALAPAIQTAVINELRANGVKTDGTINDAMFTDNAEGQNIWPIYTDGREYVRLYYAQQYNGMGIDLKVFSTVGDLTHVKRHVSHYELMLGGDLLLNLEAYINDMFSRLP